MYGWIEFTGLTFYNTRIDESNLPGREITDGMIYHMFASGLFESIKIKRDWDASYLEFSRAQMQNYVQEKDRLEINRLKAELESRLPRKKSESLTLNCPDLKTAVEVAKALRGIAATGAAPCSSPKNAYPVVSDNVISLKKR